MTTEQKISVQFEIHYLLLKITLYQDIKLIYIKNYVHHWLVVAYSTSVTLTISNHNNTDLSEVLKTLPLILHVCFKNSACNKRLDNNNCYY